MNDDDILSIQRGYEDRFRNVRRWIIAETDEGFELHQWSADGVWPPSVYPVKEAAAARLLQLLDIKHVIAPQSWPEEVCIGHIDIKDTP